MCEFLLWHSSEAKDSSDGNQTADKLRLGKMKVYQRLDDDGASLHYSIRRKYHLNQNIKPDVAQHYAPQAVLAMEESAVVK